MIIDKLETAIKFFPLIFLLLTTLGYIHLQAYYYFFDIQIINYLDLTEIVLLFFNTSILLILIILIVIFTIYILDKKIANDVKIKSAAGQPKKKFSNRLGYILFFTQIIYAILVYLSGYYIGLIYPFGYLTLIAIFFLFEKLFLKTMLKENNSFFFISLYICIAAFLLTNLCTITNSIETGYNIRNSNKEIKYISFTYKNKIVESSKNFVYVGETKSYMFLFDSKMKQTTIYKKENIDDLKMKNY